MCVNSKTKLIIIGLLLGISGLPAKAEDMFPNYLPSPAENSYEKYADESDVYYKHGMNFLTSKKYNEAVSSLEKALEAAPDRNITRINLSVAYINRGQELISKFKDNARAANDFRNAIYLLKHDVQMPTSDITITENLGIAKSNLDIALKNNNISTTKGSRLRIAKELRGQGKFREALVEYYESLEGNQTDFPVYSAIGDMYAALQNDRKAVKVFQKALTYSPNNTELHLKLANSLYGIGDTPYAIKEYNLALASCSPEEKPEVLKTLENIWVEKLSQNSQDAVAHTNLGVVLQQQGDFDGAINEYRIAEALTVDDLAARLNIRLNMGTLYQSKKDYITAINAYDSILQMDPEHTKARFYKGQSLKESGDLDGAAKEFQYLINKNPNNATAKEELFDTIRRYPNTEEVAGIFKSFAENNPTDPLAQFQYALNLHTNKIYDEALVYYKKSLALDPKFTEAYLNIANIYKEKNQVSTAISTLENGLKILPKNQKLTALLNTLKSENIDIRYQNALQKHKHGKYADAINEYLSIMQVSEPDSDLYLNLGAAYQAAKKLPEAVNAYKKAIQLNSKNSTAYYYLGTVYSAQNKNAEAVANYKKALTLDPNNNEIKLALKDAQENLSNAALQKGINEYNKAQYPQALLTFNTLAIKDPNNAYVFYYRAMVYDAMKKYQLAIADYKVAQRLYPDLTDVYYAIAVDYDTLKNYTEAKKWYTVFINKSTNKNDQYVQYAKNRIRKI
jgi:tetratricopeptide (TPR) repeat protein